MLQTFAFDRLALVMADLYFRHPEPPSGQEGAEHGVRLELRRIEAGALRGSVYSARPIAIVEPLWRVDLLGSVAANAGADRFDRTHHHPHFTGWDESTRVFDDRLSTDPLLWLSTQLSDLPTLLRRLDVPADVAGTGDGPGLRAALPRILDAVEWMLDQVWVGDLGRAPAPAPAGAGLIRSGWL